jgi:hypothetical protein
MIQVGKSLWLGHFKHSFPPRKERKDQEQPMPGDKFFGMPTLRNEAVLLDG